MADYFCKLFFLGDSRTGKTALISKLTGRVISAEYRMSVGLPKAVCSLQGESGEVRFELMENPGLDDFSSNTRLFYRAAHVILLVYSVCSAASFQGLTRWLNEVQQYCPHRYAKPGVPKVLVGCDSGGCRDVTFEDGSSFAQRHGLVFLEFSLQEDLDTATVLTGLLRLARAGTMT